MSGTMVLTISYPADGIRLAGRGLHMMNDFAHVLQNGLCSIARAGISPEQFRPHSLPTTILDETVELVHRSLEPNHAKASLVRTGLHTHKPKSFHRK